MKKEGGCCRGRERRRWFIVVLEEATARELSRQESARSTESSMESSWRRSASSRCEVRASRSRIKDEEGGREVGKVRTAVVALMVAVSGDEDQT
jgi:hypothetical protein